MADPFENADYGDPFAAADYGDPFATATVDDTPDPWQAGRSSAFEFIRAAQNEDDPLGTTTWEVVDGKRVPRLSTEPIRAETPTGKDRLAAAEANAVRDLYLKAYRFLAGGERGYRRTGEHLISTEVAEQDRETFIAILNEMRAGVGSEDPEYQPIRDKLSRTVGETLRERFARGWETANRNIDLAKSEAYRAAGVPLEVQDDQRFDQLANAIRQGTDDLPLPSAYWRAVGGALEMMPQMVTGGLATAVNPAAGMAYWMTQIQPQRQFEFEQMGFDRDRASGMALVSSVAESAIEQWGRLMPKGVENALRGKVESVVQPFREYMTQVARRYATNVAKETLEEGAQDAFAGILSTGMSWLDANVEDQSVAKPLKDAWSAMVESVGPIMVLGGAAGAIETPVLIKQYRNGADVRSLATDENALAYVAADYDRAKALSQIAKTELPTTEQFAAAGIRGAVGEEARRTAAAAVEGAVARADAASEQVRAAFDQTQAAEQRKERREFDERTEAGSLQAGRPRPGQFTPEEVAESRYNPYAESMQAGRTRVGQFTEEEIAGRARPGPRNVGRFTPEELAESRADAEFARTRLGRVVPGKETLLTPDGADIFIAENPAVELGDKPTRSDLKAAGIKGDWSAPERKRFATLIREARDRATTQFKGELAELGKLLTGRVSANPALDPEILALLGRIAVSGAKAGVLTLADFVTQTAVTLGRRPTRMIAAAIEKVASERGMKREDGQTVESILDAAADLPEVNESLTRPDLAMQPQTEAGRNLLTDVDVLRTATGKPEPFNIEAADQEADKMLAADYEGTRDRLFKDGELFVETEADVRVAMKILDREASAAKDPESLMRVAIMGSAFRDSGSFHSRMMNARRILGTDAHRANILQQAVFSYEGSILDDLKIFGREAARVAGLKDKSPQQKAFLGRIDDRRKKKIERQMKRKLAAIKAAGFDPDKIKEYAKDPIKSAQMLNVISMATANWNDVAFEWWRNMLMYGLDTQKRNAATNAANMAFNAVVERTFEFGINRWLNDDSSIRDVEELKLFWKALAPALAKGFKNGWKSFRDELPYLDIATGVMGGQKIGDFSGHAIGNSRRAGLVMGTLIGAASGGALGLPGRIAGGLVGGLAGVTFGAGRVVRAPQAATMAADQAFKTAGATMIVGQVAYRSAKARENPLSGQALQDFIRKETEDLTSDSWREAMYAVSRLTLQLPPGPITQAAVRIRKAIPFSWILMTFISFPASFARVSWQKGVPGMIRTAIRSYNASTRTIGLGKYPGIARDLSEHLSWIVAITLLLTIGRMLTDDDDERPLITGSDGAWDREKNPVMNPYEVRWGDMVVDYSTMEPAVGIVAPAVNLWRGLQSGAPDEFIVSQFQSLSMMLDKTTMSGVKDFIQVIDDPKRYGPTWTSKFAANWLPNLTRQGVREMRDDLDQNRVWGEGWDYVDRWTRRTAMRAAVAPDEWTLREPAHDEFGEPIQRDRVSPSSTWMLDYILSSPYRTRFEGVKDIHPVRRAIYNWNNQNPTESPVKFVPPDPWYEVDGKRRYLSDAQLAQRERFTGRAFAETSKLIAVDPRKPTGEQMDDLRSVRSRTLDLANDILKPHWSTGPQPAPIDEAAAIATVRDQWVISRMRSVLRPLDDKGITLGEKGERMQQAREAVQAIVAGGYTPHQVYSLMATARRKDGKPDTELKNLTGWVAHLTR